MTRHFLVCLWMSLLLGPAVSVSPGVPLSVDASFDSDCRAGTSSNCGDVDGPKLTIQNAIGAAVSRIDADPRSVQRNGRDDNIGNLDDDQRLSHGSPGMNAGDNDGVPSGVTTDLDGGPRFVDDPARPDGGNSTPPIVDVGAYEGALEECTGDGLLDVNSPGSIAGTYNAPWALFGPPPTIAGTTGDVALAEPADGCSAITNPGTINGNVALVDRGACFFQTKVKNCQDAGAIAVIVANNNADPPFRMGAGTKDVITIPSVMISQADGGTIRATESGGATVNVRLYAPEATGSCCDAVAEVCTEGVFADACTAAGEFFTCNRPCCEVECRDPAGPEYDSSNVELLSRVPIEDFAAFTGTPSNPHTGNEQWGYTSPAGHKYAIMGFTTGTGFVRVTDPTNPQIVGYLDGGGIDETWRDMAVYQDHAYIVSDGDGIGLQIADLSQIDADSVTLAGVTDLGLGFFEAHNVVVNEDSGFLYLALPNLNGNLGITAVSLADPVDPGPVYFWTDNDPDVRCHDLQVITYSTGPNAGKEVAFCFAEDDGLVIVDVTDKNNMFELGTLAYPTRVYCHQGWQSPDGRYLFFNDELDESGGTVANTRTYVADVLDLTNPVLAAVYDHPGCWIDHNLHVRGERVFQAHYAAGLRVLDVSTPTTPSEVGFFDTHPEDNVQDYPGAWGVYANPDHRTVYLSDRQRGLFVLCDEPSVPIASFTMSPSEPAAFELVDFDGTSSVSCVPGGSISSYEWDFDYDGVTFDIDATGSTVQHAYPSAGTFSPALRVTGAGGSVAAGPGGIDIATLSLSVLPGGAPALEPCSNDFVDANDGAGGERLSRFGCVSAPEPPAAAGGVGTAIRVGFRTLYNTTGADPDGASVCVDRSLLTTPQPSLSQFEGKMRWLGAPVEVLDDAAPIPPNYIGAPLVCTAAEAAVRDWSPAGLETAFGTDADTSRIYFFDSGVVPCSVYEVSHCGDPLDEGTCSAPVLVRTSRMADCWPPFNVLGQPSFTDINALVNKYKGIPFSPGAMPQGGPPEWHALQAGNVLPLPGQLTSFLDISVGVDSYKGLPYKERGPCDPDTGLDDCGAPCTP